MNNNFFDFKNKVVVITGAGGIICGEIAKKFATLGAKVALLDLRPDSARKYADEIKLHGGIAKVYEANVLDKKQLEKIKEVINLDFGSVDILINGAGGNNSKATTEEEFYQLEQDKINKDFFDLDEIGVQFVFNLNFLGTFLPTQVFAKDMLKKKDASIINISSMNAYTPLTKIPAYSGAKAAISNFTQWLAVYFSSVGIRCNAIAPGFLVTDQNKNLLFDENGIPTKRANKILENTPMQRFGKSEELLGAILYLADYSLSSFVNGIVLPIDGGFSAYSGV